MHQQGRPRQVRARPGTSTRLRARRGTARQGSCVRRGKPLGFPVRRHRVAFLGRAWLGFAWRRSAGPGGATQGKGCFQRLWHRRVPSPVRMHLCGKARPGVPGLGTAGLGKARHGMARAFFSGSDIARCPSRCECTAWTLVRPGMAWPGETWLGGAGNGRASRGGARQDNGCSQRAPQRAAVPGANAPTLRAWQGLARPGRAWLGEARPGRATQDKGCECSGLDRLRSLPVRLHQHDRSRRRLTAQRTTPRGKNHQRKDHDRNHR